MGKDTTENSIPVCPEENGTINKKTPPGGSRPELPSKRGYRIPGSAFVGAATDVPDRTNRQSGDTGARTAPDQRVA